jgi:hypothetical protein
MYVHGEFGSQHNTEKLPDPTGSHPVEAIKQEVRLAVSLSKRILFWLALGGEGQEAE